MKINLIKILFLSFFLIAGKSYLYSVELMTPATQMSPEKVHLETYYRKMAKQDLSITVGGSGMVQVKNSRIPTYSTTDLDAEGNGNGTMAKVTVQPFDEPRIQLYFLGGMSNYELKVPSGSFSNSYKTDQNGYIFGGGLRYTLVPYTMVTPAVSLDLSATHSRYNLSRFESGDGKIAEPTGFLMIAFEIQAAITASKKFVFDLGKGKASFDPYLGVKMIRTRINLDDLSTGAHHSGTKIGTAPFVGFRFNPHQRIGLIVEGSFLNELSASAGLTFNY